MNERDLQERLRSSAAKEKPAPAKKCPSCGGAIHPVTLTCRCFND